MDKKKKRRKQKSNIKNNKVKHKNIGKRVQKKKTQKVHAAKKTQKAHATEKIPKIQIEEKIQKARNPEPKQKRQIIEKSDLLTYMPAIRKLVIPVVVLTIVLMVVLWVVSTYKVQTVYVSGNVHYTDEEITNMVTEGRLGNNTAYLFLKYRNKDIKNIPFIETMSVSIENPTTIRINVYEKSLAGYVDYLDRYMYFDRDGVIVESSDLLTDGIPQVVGLNFDHLILHEKLPVENEDVFQEILSITQLLNKFSLVADRICFDSNYDLSLYFGQVKVIIGNNQSIDEKIMVLPDILPKLEGKKGILNLENYQKGDTITFETAEHPAIDVEPTADEDITNEE